jgi:AraC family transcriptional regulator
LKFKTNQNITQIAINSGYETNASFSKAFKKHFGMTPKEFSKNAKIKQGDKMLEPKIIKMKDIEILYVRKVGAYQKAAQDAWEILMPFAYEKKMKEKKNIMGDKAMMFGIGHDNPHHIEVDKLRYDACISWDDKTVQPEGEIQSKIIDGGKYAIFLHKGAYTELINTYDGVADWIVESESEVRDLPIIEKYLNRDPRRTKPENLKTEIYVPIC